MKSILFIFFITFTVFFTGGCSKNGRPPINEVPEEKSNVGDYKIKVIKASELKEKINNRNGKALFINVWATWCIPCVEEFPGIVKAYEEYKDKDIEFISLSIDLPEDLDKSVIPFLKKQEAKFPVYIIDEQESEKIINILNESWSGALPATFIYNSSGQQEVFILGAESYSNFKNKIEEVMKL